MSVKTDRRVNDSESVLYYNIICSGFISNILGIGPSHIHVRINKRKIISFMNVCVCISSELFGILVTVLFQIFHYTFICLY